MPKVAGLQIHQAAAAILAEAIAGMSHDDIRRAISEALPDSNGMDGPWVRDVYDSEIVYEYDGKLYRASYTITEGTAQLGESSEVRATYVDVAGEPDAAAAVGESLRLVDGKLPTATRTFREAMVATLKDDDRFRAEVATVLERIAQPDLAELLTEAAVETLAEAALGNDGVGLVKLIDPGWGSSGYWSETVLKTDGPKAWPAGTKMMWDHATASESRDHPEGTLDRLAAELIEDASWKSQGPRGPGLYARAKVFGRYREAVDELAPHIGVSVRTGGRTVLGEAEGRSGKIVQEIAPSQLNTVDFVTMPGRGGEIVTMFEAAGRGAMPTITDPKGDEVDEAQLKEALATAERERDEAKAATATAIEEAKTERARRVSLDAVAIGGKLMAEASRAKFPAPIRARVLETVTADVPMTEAGAVDEAKFAEAIDAELTKEARYLASIDPKASPVVGLGESRTDKDDDDKEDDLSEAWASVGEAIGNTGTIQESFVKGRS